MYRKLTTPYLSAGQQEKETANDGGYLNVATEEDPQEETFGFDDPSLPDHNSPSAIAATSAAGRSEEDAYDHLRRAGRPEEDEYDEPKLKTPEDKNPIKTKSWGGAVEEATAVCAKAAGIAAFKPLYSSSDGDRATGTENAAYADIDGVDISDHSQSTAAAPPIVALRSEPAAPNKPAAYSAEAPKLIWLLWLIAILALCTGVAGLLLGLGLFDATTAEHAGQLEQHTEELRQANSTIATLTSRITELESQLVVQNTAIQGVEMRTAPLEESVGAIALMVGYITTSTTSTTSSTTSRTSTTLTSSTTGTTVTLATGSSTTATSTTMTSSTTTATSSTLTSSTTTASTTTVSSTTASSTTTVAGQKAAGNVFVSQVHDPAALCQGSLDSPTGCVTLTVVDEATLVRVDGALVVQNSKLSSLAGRFPALVTVRGAVKIVFNTELETLGDAFAALRHIDGGLTIANIGHVGAGVGPDAGSAFSAAFAALESVGGNLTLQRIEKLPSIDAAFPALVTVDGSLIVGEMPHLLDIGTAFGALRAVGGNLTFTKNPLHATMTASFPELRTVNGTLSMSWYSGVVESPGLTAILGAFPRLATVLAGSLQLEHLRRLQRLQGSFGSLVSIGADLELSGLPELRSLSGSFGALTNVTGTLAMHGFADGYSAGRDAQLPALACRGDLYWKGTSTIQAPARAGPLEPC